MDVSWEFSSPVPRLPLSVCRGSFANVAFLLRISFSLLSPLRSPRLSTSHPLTRKPLSLWGQLSALPGSVLTAWRQSAPSPQAPGLRTGLEGVCRTDVWKGTASWQTGMCSLAQEVREPHGFQQPRVWRQCFHRELLSRSFQNHLKAGSPRPMQANLWAHLPSPRADVVTGQV